MLLLRGVQMPYFGDSVRGDTMNMSMLTVELLPSLLKSMEGRRRKCSLTTGGNV